MKNSEEIGDLPLGLGESEEAGTCLEALAQANIPWRSKTAGPQVAPDWSAGSMR